MAATDILTSTEIRIATFGSAGLTSYEDQLAVLNTAISNQIDRLCGPVVRRTVTDETHDGGKAGVRLYNRPVASVAAVTEYRSTTPTSVTSDSVTLQNQNGFILRGTEGRLIRRSSGGAATFAPGLQNVVVTYSAGRVAATTSTGSETFKQAATLMARDVWRGQSGQGTETYGSAFDEQGNLLLGPELLNKVKALLYRELLPPVVG